MTGGIVVGGWEFVWAAYGLTFLALGAYGTSLALRLREAKRRASAEEEK